ncbi:MAG: hypothetical protein BWY78_00459 [Alphaproteobacteria bacterium ADurb.Bin438]|nr:MAG: hypothetical protein BWY78_00459 [Alphaproteobacteria bacterium ADurb.Bin438]
MGFLPDTKKGDKQIMSLFLSLYLIVLVFLIALLSMSSFSGLRFETATKSVRESFKPKIKNHFLSKKINYKSGNNEAFLINTEESFLKNMGNVFTKELPLVKVIETQSGLVMYAYLEKNEFFEEDGINLRSDRTLFFKNLAEKMKSNSPLYSYKIEILLKDDEVQESKFFNSDKKSYLKASNILNTFIGFGVKPYEIYCGFGRVEEKDIKIIFDVEKVYK